MAGYDPMQQLPYLASPMSLDNLTPNDYLGTLPVTIPEQAGFYDAGDFAGGNDDYIPPTLRTEHSRQYSNPYDSEFGDMLDGSQEIAIPETSIERDNKLLSFSLPTYNFTLLDYSLHRTSLSLTAQLHGMFFMAESPSTVPLDRTKAQTELTCYRRNLFQITGSITLPRMMRYILTEHGDRIPILAQELTISATESAEGHPVKLISVPWKTPASNATSTPEDKSEKEPTAIPLDTMSNQDMDADYATFPIAWKRLQFRIATANNGRRKELQQHFIVRLKVVATLSTGTKIPICEAKSGAIIVRGRSPRNFQQRKDFPVGSSGNIARKAMQPPAMNRGATSEPSLTQPSHPSPMKTETSPEFNITSFSFEKNGLQPSATFGGDKAVATSKSSRSASDSRPSPSTTDTPPAAPLRLNLTDEMDFPPRTNKAARTDSINSISRPGVQKHPSSGFVFSPNTQANLVSGLDSADLLYEYFPLGLDDWMPPVDAVYRPHVVHHVAAAGPTTGGKASMGGRSKRYFSEDQS